MPLDKQLRMMELMLKLYHGAKDISPGHPLSQLKEVASSESLAKMKYGVSSQEKFAEYDIHSLRRPAAGQQGQPLRLGDESETLT